MDEKENILIAPAALFRIKPTDFVSGEIDAFSGEEPELYPDGCIAYLPLNEAQIGIYFDTYGCVSFSANNALETDGNYKIKNKIYSAENIKWLEEIGYSKNGILNFSDRDLIVMSETMPDLGNYLDKVADTARNKYLIPESMAPWDFRNRDASVNNKANYYNYKRSEAAQKIAEEFGKRFEVRYRLVALSNFSSEGKKRVIQVLSCSNSGKNGELYYCPVSHQSGHAMMQARNRDWSIFDHYNPYLKNYEGEKDFYPMGMSFSLVEKNMSNTQKPVIADNTLIQLVTAPGGFGMYLSGNIIVDSLDKIIASWLVRNGGNLNGKTKALVKDQWDMFPKVNLKMEKL